MSGVSPTELIHGDDEDDFMEADPFPAVSIMTELIHGNKTDGF